MPPFTLKRKPPLSRSNLGQAAAMQAKENDLQRQHAINQIGAAYEAGGAQSENSFADPGAEADAAKDYDMLKRRRGLKNVRLGG